jgi:polar amino acid transport system permease protein
MTALAPPPIGKSAHQIANMQLVPRRHYGRIVASVVIIVLLLGFARALSKSQIEWSYVRQFLTAPVILSGLAHTLLMTVCAMLLGIGLGVIFAIMRVSPNPVLRSVAMGYIFLFRGAPALLQLLLWFNLALIFPTIGIPGLFEFRTVDLMTPFVAAMLGLGIQQGAYTAEVVRGGLLAVDAGQYEAARAIGMTQFQMLRRIVLPQAMRVIVPPVGNEVIGMVKLTSLASVIQYDEILHNAQIIYFANSRVLELLIVASIWYLLAVSLLSIAQYYIERHFGRGATALRTGV